MLGRDSRLWKCYGPIINRWWLIGRWKRDFMEGDECYKFSTINKIIKTPILTAVDIGSRTGVITKMMLEFFPSIEVLHAYEVLPELCQKTLEAVGNDRRVKVILAAVTSQSGKLYLNEYNYQMFNPDMDRGASIVSTSPSNPIDARYISKELSIPRYSLEKIVENMGRQIDLIKIDCEGCEHSLFKCVSQQTLKKIRYITGEYHGSADNFAAVIKRVKLTHKIEMTDCRSFLMERV